MKKYFSCFIFLFPFIFSAISIQSCCKSKVISSVEKNPTSASNQKLPGTLSISPKMFRVNAVLTAEPEVDSLNQKTVYTLFILDVVERGSSLSLLAAAGDTIQGESFHSISSLKTAINKGDKVVAFIEEQLKLNSDRPTLVIRDIRKK